MNFTNVFLFGYCSFSFFFSFFFFFLVCVCVCVLTGSAKTAKGFVLGMLMMVNQSQMDNFLSDKFPCNGSESILWR